MGSIFLRGKIQWIKYYRNGKPYRESSKSEDEAKAKRLLKFREAQIETGVFKGLKAERVKFDEIAQDYLNDYKINTKKSLSTAEIYVRHLSAFFGGMRAANITTTEVLEYVIKCQEEGLSSATINRRLSALKRMFSLGTKTSPPKILNIPHIPHLAENNVRTGFFEYDEYLAIRGALPDYLKAVVSIAFHTGFRKGEILSLKWDQVDMERGRIVLEVGTTKNNEGRVAYMPDDLYKVLEAQKRFRDTKFPHFSYVCFRIENKKPIKIGDTRVAWRKACKAIGLEGKLIHDFRRTAVRNMVRAGVPEKVAMMVSGHKSRAIFERYNICNEDDIALAAKKLNSFYGHNPGTIDLNRMLDENGKKPELIETKAIFLG